MGPLDYILLASGISKHFETQGERILFSDLAEELANFTEHGGTRLYLISLAVGVS